MTKRFGNGGSRGGRSGRGKRRNETERAAGADAGSPAPADAAAQADGAQPEGAQVDGAGGADAAAGAAGEAGSTAAATADPACDPGGGADPGADAGGNAGAAAGGDSGAGAGSDSGAAEAAAGGAKPAAELDQLRAQVSGLQDELLRKQADFENFRKRLNRDKDEAIKFANTGLLIDLTAVLDDFERAISAAAQSEDFATLHSGIELIEKQLLNTLQRKWGLTRFDSAGQPFDPERHEALATAPSADHAETTVIEDYQKGYTLHGRVIRAARVRVVTPAAPAAGDDESTAAGDGSDDPEKGA